MLTSTGLLLVAAALDQTLTLLPPQSSPSSSRGGGEELHEGILSGERCLTVWTHTISILRALGGIEDKDLTSAAAYQIRRK